ncbi:hypothetical protein C8J57DRAFT_1222784 [Mycena rebaudengoi]|nr:hypothetical protein C8J57DRAFT_1222784 [Mycena rebaudengoi]
MTMGHVKPFRVLGEEGVVADMKSSLKKRYRLTWSLAHPIHERSYPFIGPMAWSCEASICRRHCIGWSSTRPAEWWEEAGLTVIGSSLFHLSLLYMRYGADDPALWPQEWTDNYCHFSAIAEPGSRPDIDVMWWDPLPADFKFLPPINQLMAQCTDMRKTSKVPPLIGELINTVLMWAEQLQTLPSTYVKMVYAVTSMQRTFLQLDALYHYITVYQLRMRDYTKAPANNTPVARCMGAFTSIPAKVQQLFTAHLLFWFLRPFYVFDAESILAIVELREPTSISGPSTFAPPIVYSGNSTREKMTAILHAAIQTPWYQDPFATGSSSSSLPTPSSLTQLLSTSRKFTQEDVGAAKADHHKAAHRTECRKGHAAKGPTAKPQHDKFVHLAVDGMPPPIVAWATALANINQSVVPFTSNPADTHYVLPEPVLLVNSTPDRRHAQVPSSLELAVGSLHLHAQPARACRTSQHAGMEGRTSGADRKARRGWIPRADSGDRLAGRGIQLSLQILLDWVKACFAGGMLLGVPLEIGKRGWAAPAIEEHHRYVLRMATLCWIGQPNPLAPILSTAFWEYFGWAAVIPLRLEHEPEKEEGEL